MGPENGVELSKEELIRRKREEFIQKHGRGMEKSNKSTKSDAPKEKGKKAPRVWELGGCANKEVLDYSTPTTNGSPEAALSEDINLIRGTGPGGSFRIWTAAALMMKGLLKTPPSLVRPRERWVACLVC